VTTLGKIELDRIKGPLLRIVREADPQRTYLGVYEYVVVDSSDSTVDCRVTDESTGLPDLAGIPYRSSVLGETVSISSGSIVSVAFVNGLPSHPIVVGSSQDNPPGDASISAGTLSFEGASMPPTEHAISTEAVVNMFVNFIYLLAAAGVTGLAGVGKMVDPTDPTMAVMTSAITAWLAASMIPAVPAGVTPGGMLLPGITTPLSAALAAKLPNVLGTIPGVGCKGIRLG